MSNPLKILCGWPLEDMQTGMYITETLRSMGHIIYNVDPKVIYRESFLQGKNVPEEITKIMLAAAEEVRPNMVFISRQGWFERTAEVLSKKIPVVGWNVDVRYNPEEEWKSLHGLIRKCTHWMTIAGGNVDWYRRHLNKNTHWLSEACYPLVHRPPKKEEMDTIRSSTIYGNVMRSTVSFAGTLSDSHTGPPPRMDLISAVGSAFNLRIWGPSTQYLVNEDHSIMARFTPVNLGHSGWPLVSLSQSARDYRIMAAGGFLLTNRVKNYDTYFSPGVHMDDYSTVEEAVEKIRFYKDHEKERDLIRIAGGNEVQDKHTFTHRMQRMLRIVLYGKDEYMSAYQDWYGDSPMYRIEHDIAL